ncbi:hypothetical protein JCM13580A_41600 [Streptomyces drozdowiczii]
MATPINGGTQGLWIDPHQVGKAATAADRVAEDIPGDIQGLFKTTGPGGLRVRVMNPGLPT